MPQPVVIGLSAVIVSLVADEPAALVTGGGAASALPFGPFDPAADRTFELALRGFVARQTGFAVGYVEQLYTFGDKGREAPLADLGTDGGASDARVVSVCYLALTPDPAEPAMTNASWCSWYGFFPWEDVRNGRPTMIDRVIAPALLAWAKPEEGGDLPRTRLDRARIAFGLDGAPWNEERTLERYELLYEAGLVQEAARDRGVIAAEVDPAIWGTAMASDHRRILATAIGRLRGKLKYRPIVFELVPSEFTLLGLQRAVEAIAGLELHKQNFRRLLEGSGLIEPTGGMEQRTGGKTVAPFRRRTAPISETVGGIHVPRPRDG
jgi:hypothetical protein